MAIREIQFPSHNGRDQIQAWVYEPVRPARAVVQLVHGLGEHSRRYLHMVSTLLDAGCVVAADDHAGHGRTAMVSGEWGDTGEDGVTTVIEDEASLHDRVRELHPGVPFFMFGHSWGSMIGRGYALEHSEDLSGLALCGVAAQIHGIETVVDRASLAARITAGEATTRDDRYVDQMFDGFISRYGHVNGPTDWIAVDPDVVRDHAQDPFNNFTAPMTLRFVQDFIDLYDQVNAPGWYTQVRPDLPVLLLSGDMDPVANYGEGTYHVANQLQMNGHSDVRTRVWTGFRHEIHNDPDTRALVEEELVHFIEAHL
ncbi:MAG: lysophospholipase [Actinomyces sp.]|nr:lysophospholipase [Actinomyces sp.]MDN6428244.1 lysophospholipase [Propionibacterium sp.]MDN6794765.1 lysophospholipase [Propionibacterium sp.]